MLSEARQLARSSVHLVTRRRQQGALFSPSPHPDGGWHLLLPSLLAAPVVVTASVPRPPAPPQLSPSKMPPPPSPSPPFPPRPPPCTTSRPLSPLVPLPSLSLPPQTSPRAAAAFVVVTASSSPTSARFRTSSTPSTPVEQRNRPPFSQRTASKLSPPLQHLSTRVALAAVSTTSGRATFSAPSLAPISAPFVDSPTDPPPSTLTLLPLRLSSLSRTTRTDLHSRRLHLSPSLPFLYAAPLPAPSPTRPVLAPPLERRRTLVRSG
jgi:hypothetical protein